MIGAVASENVGLRHRQGIPASPGYPRMNSPALIGRPLSGKRLHTAAFDRRLVDAVLVSQRITVAGLGAEVLDGQNFDRPRSPRIPSERSRGRGAFSSESLKALTPIWT